MAIKGGQIIHAGNGQTVIDRIQTGGPGQVNIPTEKIYELGNYKSLATVRDVPDLTFSMESYDVSTEIETLVTNAYGGRSVSDAVTTAASTTLTSASAAFTSADIGRQVVIPGAGAGGGEHVTTIDSITSATEVVLADAAVGAVADADLSINLNGIDLATAKPIDIASQFKAGKDAASPFAVVTSVALPFLYLESMSYRFGYRDNASQSASFRGDSIFYNPGPTFVETAPGSGVQGQTLATTQPAFQSSEGDARRVLSVTVGSKRLALGADYTEAYGAVSGGAAITTITIKEPVLTSETIRIVYASPSALAYDQSVHAGVEVIPAALKGSDIDIYLGGYDPNVPQNEQLNWLAGVQSTNVDWRVQMDKDNEMGNAYAVAQDFDVPTVTGSVEIRPRDPQDFQAILRRMTGVSDATKVLGTKSSTPLPLDIVLRHPETGVTLKRLHVPDARFTVPGYQGRVNQKTNISVSFESDEGTLKVFAR